MILLHIIQVLIFRASLPIISSDLLNANMEKHKSSLRSVWMDGWIVKPERMKIQFSSSFKGESCKPFSFGTFQKRKQKYSVRNSPHRYINFTLIKTLQTTSDAMDSYSRHQLTLTSNTREERDVVTS